VAGGPGSWSLGARGRSPGRVSRRQLSIGKRKSRPGGMAQRGTASKAGDQWAGVGRQLAAQEGREDEREIRSPMVDWAGSERRGRFGGGWGLVRRIFLSLFPCRDQQAVPCWLGWRLAARGCSVWSQECRVGNCLGAAWCGSELPIGEGGTSSNKWENQTRAHRASPLRRKTLHDGRKKGAIPQCTEYGVQR